MAQPYNPESTPEPINKAMDGASMAPKVKTKEAVERDAAETQLNEYKNKPVSLNTMHVGSISKNIEEVSDFLKNLTDPKNMLWVIGGGAVVAYLILKK